MRERKESIQKRGNQTIWIALILCAALVLFVVGYLTVGDRISASLSLNRLQSDLERAETEEVTAVVTHYGFFTDTLDRTATAIMTGEDAQHLVKELSSLSDAMKFKEKRALGSGRLGRTVSLRFDGTVLTLYVTENEFYFAANDGACVAFTPQESMEESYRALYTSLTEKLEQSRPE